MKRRRRRKCWHCGDLFHPDPCNRYHQKYCSEPACRKVSKVASQRRWLAKPRNRDYFHGPAHVARVQAWRAAHPGYWRRQGSLTLPALQEHCITQPIDTKQKTSTLTDCALQEVLNAQPFVLIGLIANLTGSALQDDLALTGRRLQQLGRDILEGGPHGEKSPVMSRTGAPDPVSVQLGRSAPGPP